MELQHMTPYVIMSCFVKLYLHNIPHNMWWTIPITYSMGYGITTYDSICCGLGLYKALSEKVPLG